jgi:glycosyltransferase involved in cell wall biosynthesis
MVRPDDSATGDRKPMPSEKPRVSIGIAIYNAATTLPRCIQSIFAQTEEDWELLLLDDGSTDSSLSIASQIEDPRVRVVADGENRGLTVRLNQLTALSSADIVVRMDADDMMAPTRLEQQLAVLKRKPTVDVVVSQSYLIDGAGDVYGIDSKEPLGEDRTMFLRVRSRWFAHPSMTARKTWMTRHPYDESFRLGQERELFCRAYDPRSFCKIDEPLLFYLEAGSVRIKSYRSQRHTDRRLLRMYGPEIIGWPRSLRLWGVTTAKEAVYTSAHRVGVMSSFDRLVARARAVGIREDELSKAQEILAVIARTQVPGLKSPEPQAMT